MTQEASRLDIWTAHDADTSEPAPAHPALLAFVEKVQPLIAKHDHQGCYEALVAEHESQMDAASTQMGLTGGSGEGVSEIATLTALEVQKRIRDGKLTIEEAVKDLHSEKLRRPDALKGNAAWHISGPGAPEYWYNKDSKDKRLEGFIFTIKDSFMLKDAPCTSGLMINLDRIPSMDCDTIQRLRNAGASITTKGTVPQLLFSMETASNIYGTGTNAVDPTRTCGGSTGGGASMCASGFVNVVLGSDVAGSIRIPALHNGIHGFKGSPQRVSCDINQPSWDNRPFGSDRFSEARSTPKPTAVPNGIIPPTSGVLGRSVKDLEAVMEVLCEMDPYHPTMNDTNIGWRKDVPFKKRVGVCRSIHFLPASKAALRAVEIAEASLIKQGYELVDITEAASPILEEAFFVAVKAFDHNAGLSDLLMNRTKVYEPFTALFDTNKLVNYIPNVAMRLLSWTGLADPRACKTIDAIVEGRAQGLGKIGLDQHDLYRKLMTVYQEHELSAVLSPGLPIPACPLFESPSVMWSCMYTFVWNLFRMPAGVMTVTTVQDDEQIYKDTFNDKMTGHLNKVMEGSAGMPMGISVTAPVNRDEVVMQIMLDMEDSGLINPIEVVTNQSSNQS